MKIIFFGSSKYSVIVAKKLHQEFNLKLVVTTQADSFPVKFAAENNIDHKVVSKFDRETIEQIEKYKPDFNVVADFGKILPEELLKLPKFDSLNVHHSLLPKYRGPSPAPTAILNGEKVTGVSIISMQRGVDQGPVFLQNEYEIKDIDTTDSLLTKLNVLGADLVSKVIKNFENEKPIPQDESEVTITYLLKRADGFIDIDNPPPPDKLNRMIRAYFPWPNVFFEAKLNGKGKIIKLLPDKQIQAEGKKPMSYKDFINGYKEGKYLLRKINLISN
ncbi:MAG: hypothetical protein HYT08_05235 [Candidatus Levybacteria bacterium]|nr:hypothetical protein [Candidatus Levybacteria bacterium]